MSNFGSYKGREFLELNLPKRKFLVDGIIREKDSVLLVGSEKSGKSLLIKQLICSMTSQQPFLDRYAVNRPCKVTYIQLEGELEDSQDRLKRMMETQELDPDLFHLIFSPPLQLNIKEAAEDLLKEIQRTMIPDVLILDPLYFSFNGSMSDDQVVRQFIGNIRILKEELNCAIILVHHTHKVKFNFKDGVPLNEGDEAMFGSKFLKAYPDHTLLFIFDKKKQVRYLTCNTQRSGDIIQSNILRLVEPTPLYFEMAQSIPSQEDVILKVLQRKEFRDGLECKHVLQATGLARSTFFDSVKKLIIQKQVVKIDSGRPVIYKAILKPIIPDSKTKV